MDRILYVDPSAHAHNPVGTDLIYCVIVTEVRSTISYCIRHNLGDNEGVDDDDGQLKCNPRTLGVY